MTFKEADKRLAKIANGKYRSITYCLKTHRDESQEAEVRLYFADDSRVVSSGYCKTFGEAFQVIGEVLTPDEIPEVSA